MLSLFNPPHSPPVMNSYPHHRHLSQIPMEGHTGRRADMLHAANQPGGLVSTIPSGISVEEPYKIGETIK
ncbi:hypothetical protein SAMN04487895_11918 [Paenibacillus sophorae]|uniref:Uncharacterized protein n=1 Tax=Paenibacillus sophorae TaxID=1333845 RepID=A0A1H8UTJ1_9BACL|nr:hypothetical protein SAMN04487895_11918 [Paenibacillus sophorae]